jgi:hypothetical protein
LIRRSVADGGVDVMLRREREEMRVPLSGVVAAIASLDVSVV